MRSRRKRLTRAEKIAAAVPIPDATRYRKKVADVPRTPQALPLDQLFRGSVRVSRRVKRHFVTTNAER